MAVYTVEFKMTQHGNTNMVDVIADSKVDAYDKATYEIIPKKEDSVPYSSWVRSVTYQNGNYKLFNTFEGKPY